MNNTTNYRIFVEKLPRFRVEAESLRRELNTNLNLSLGEVRLLCVYDLFGFSEELLEKSRYTVFGEVVTDSVTDTFDLAGRKYIAVEYLPGQFDQRAASAVDCVRLIDPAADVRIRSSKLLLFEDGTTDEELEKVAAIVNQEIRKNYPLEESRAVPIGQAKKMGAMAIFGEKYGDLVRVVKFGESVELCGGTHAHATGQIGFFKIISESSVSAGVRRIEAITAAKAEEYILNYFKMMKEIDSMFKSNRGVLENVRELLNENEGLKKDVEKFTQESLRIMKEGWKNEKCVIRDINMIVKTVMMPPANVKDIAFQLKGELNNLILVIGGVFNNKPHLTVMFSDSLVKDFGLHAGQIVKDAAVEIKGGGGGQPFFATAGGSNPDGVSKALERAEKLILDKIH